MLNSYGLFAEFLVALDLITSFVGHSVEDTEANSSAGETRCPVNITSGQEEGVRSSEGSWALKGK